MEILKDILVTVGCWVGIMLLCGVIGKIAHCACRYKNVK